MLRTILILMILNGCAIDDAVTIGPDAVPVEVPYMCEGEATHGWNSWYWPDNSVIEVFDYTGSDRFMVAEAIASWNALGSHVTLVLTKTADASGGPAVIVKANPLGEYFGFAAVDLEGDQLIGGRVMLHPDMFGYSDNVRQRVICQELGHILGLQHIVGDTCMDDCSQATDFTECLNDPDAVTPNARDTCQLSVQLAGVP